MQIISPVSRLFAYKISGCSSRGIFSNLGLNGGGRKNEHFQGKTGHVSKTLRDRVKVAIIH